MRFSWVNQRFNRITVKKFLKHHGVSHRMFSSIKEAGTLALNRHLIHTSRMMKRGDRITIDIPPEKASSRVAVSNGPLRILFEDSNWLAINKPAGLTSVPGPSNRNDTAVNRIKGYLLRSGSKNLRPHLITRLDSFTSGVVLVAKHRLANNLANQLRGEHRIKKTYLAVVSGRLERDHGSIKMPIGKLPNEIRRHRMSNGKPAWTEYWVLRRDPKFTVVRVRLHTGRTHQIRVHFAEVSHPVVGDHLYGGPLNLGIHRQALHASRIQMPNPFTRHRLDITAKLPSDVLKLISGASINE